MGRADTRAGEARVRPTHPWTADTPTHQDATGTDGKGRQTTRANAEPVSDIIEGSTGRLILGPSPRGGRGD